MDYHKATDAPKLQMEVNESTVICFITPFKTCTGEWCTASDNNHTPRSEHAAESTLMLHTHQDTTPAQNCLHGNVQMHGNMSKLFMAALP